jgi:hypothetical protein
MEARHPRPPVRARPEGKGRRAETSNTACYLLRSSLGPFSEAMRPSRRLSLAGTRAPRRQTSIATQGSYQIRLRLPSGLNNKRPIVGTGAETSASTRFCALQKRSGSASAVVGVPAAKPVTVAGPCPPKSEAKRVNTRREQRARESGWLMGALGNALGRRIVVFARRVRHLAILSPLGHQARWIPGYSLATRLW